MAFEKETLEKDIAAATKGTADTAAAGTRKAAEAVRRVAGETVGQTAAAGQQAAEHTSHLAGLSADGAEEMARQGQRNMDALIQYNTALMEGAQSLWREWLTLNQETLDRRMDALSTLLRSPNPQAAFAVQSQWLKDEMTLAINHGVRLTQMAAVVARDAAGRVSPR